MAFPRAPWRNRLAAYGVGLACGIVLLFTLMPLDAIDGTGGLWRAPPGDMAQGLTGHLALQQDAWRIPPLFARNLFWPRGVSIALTDSNPLFSLAAKLLGTLRGGGAVNLLGVWLAACWLLQPLAGVFALRALTRSVAGAAAVAVLVGLFPALLVRIGHVNLCGHFLLLLALGMTLRLLRTETRGRWAMAALVLTVAILSHPYLFMAAAATLAAVPVQAAIRHPSGWWHSWVRFLGAAAIPVLAFVGLAGTLGGGDKGFVFYSMNLLSPFWPQRSGLFGADLPVIDATGGQYEGFCYLGAGALLLLAAALPRAGGLRRWPGLVAVLVALTLIALSSRVYAGHAKLLDLGVKPWEDVFAVFRASGRAFWPVGYALVIGSVYAACRLPRRAGVLLLGGAIILQVIDTTPVRLAAARILSGQDDAASDIPALPAGGTLLTVLPTPGCTAAPEARRIGSPMLLAGVRAGMRLGDVGVGRLPSWFSCEAVLSDGLELPLRPREIRVFADPGSRQALRPALLGPGADCRSETDGVVVCARDLALPGDGSVPPGRPAPILVAGVDVAGPALAPLLGWGWREGPDGAAWSEGPRASLVFRLPTGGDFDLVLRITGMAASSGGVRRVSVSAGPAALATLDLPDGEIRDIPLHVPAAGAPDGVLRLALDIPHPLDPAKRGMAAPVRRAGIRLAAIGLRAAAPPRAGP